MISVHLPSEVADQLLVQFGWTIEQLPEQRGVAFVKPGGKRRAEGGEIGADFLWARDEALTVALIAHAETIGTSSDADNRGRIA